jgi:small subunit ribosomal protein S29
MLIIWYDTGQDVVNASTDYSPLPNTTPQLWTQNKYIATILDRTVKANRAVLDTLVLQKEHTLPIPLESDISLARLCELGARDPDVSWPFFQAFWSEMSADGRPPLLICLDSISHVMQRSEYRAPDVNGKPVYIHAHDLVIIRHFTEVLSGAIPLPNGGAVVGAASRSHAPVSKSINLAVQRGLERQAGKEITKRDPYEKKYDERADKVLESVEVLKLKGLKKYEARGLMEYWAQSGVFRRKVNEEEVAEKWALAGNGIVGEIERGALRMRI